ncbi:MAG: transcriptional regulator, MarR family [Actinomycetia bacterium]|nr:transcriptional regulator, MarR family [Actinomycetes bacterium]
MAREPSVRAVAPPERLWHRSTWLLSQVSARSYRLVLDHLGTANARTDYAVLAGLDEFGPISQAALGRRLGLDRSDIVALLNDLERGGLVARTPDDSDRRRNSVTITAGGKRALRRLDKRVDAAQQVLLAPLNVSERRQLNALLQRLLEHHTAFRTPEQRSP